MAKKYAKTFGTVQLLDSVIGLVSQSSAELIRLLCHWHNCTLSNSPRLVRLWDKHSWFRQSRNVYV